MAVTIDCGEGKHEPLCTGTIHGASWMWPQTADYPDRPCACRCHIRSAIPEQEAGNNDG